MSKLINQPRTIGFTGSNWYIEKLSTIPIEHAIGYCLEKHVEQNLNHYTNFDYTVIREDIGLYHQNPLMKNKKVNAIFLDWPGNITDTKIHFMSDFLSSEHIMNKVLLVHGYTKGQETYSTQKYINTLTGEYVIGPHRYRILDLLTKIICENRGFKYESHGCIEYKRFKNSHPGYFHISYLERK